jgi:hypothetical protein
MDARPLWGSRAHHSCTRRRRRRLGWSSPTTKDGDGWWIQAGSGGERRGPWMLIEVGFPNEKEGKWKRESSVVETGWI